MRVNSIGLALLLVSSVASARAQGPGENLAVDAQRHRMERLPLLAQSGHRLLHCTCPLSGPMKRRNPPPAKRHPNALAS